MATLPKELYLQIFAYLEYRYLRAVCETCRTFAALVRPLMFEVLQFRGDAQPQQYYFENSAQVRYPVRVKTVELAHLDEAVEEVLRLGFVRYVKTFKFGPKFYVSGMWSAYGQWVDDEINQETSAFDIGENESDFEEDDEFAYVGLRRLDEARRGRLAKELSVVTQAEQLWDQKIAEQTRKKDAINTALVKLFDQMPKLDTIEIVPWKIDIQEFGIEDRIE